MNKEIADRMNKEIAKTKNKIARRRVFEFQLISLAERICELESCNTLREIEGMQLEMLYNTYYNIVSFYDNYCQMNEFLTMISKSETLR